MLRNNSHNSEATCTVNSDSTVGSQSVLTFAPVNRFTVNRFTLVLKEKGSRLEQVGKHNPCNTKHP